MSDNENNTRIAIPTSGQVKNRVRFGNIEIDGLNVQACLGVFVVAMIILVGALGFRGNQISEGRFADRSHFMVTSAEEMIDLLKENELWNMDDNGGAVSPLLFASYPGNINDFDIRMLIL